MLNNFIYAKAKSLFEEKLSAGEVLDEAIVFIEDTKEIWNHGTYFASIEEVAAQFANIQLDITELQNAIADIQNSLLERNLGSVDSGFIEVEEPIIPKTCSVTFVDSDGSTTLAGEGNTSWIKGKRCLVKKTDTGVAICYLDDNNSQLFYDGVTAASLDGSMGQWMTDIPEYYFKMDESTSGAHILNLSNVSKADYKQSRRVLLGVTKGVNVNGKLWSRKTGSEQSTGNLTSTVFHNYANAIGTGFDIIDYEAHCKIAHLFYAKYLNRNPQTMDKFRYGEASNTRTIGTTSSLGNNDGKTSTQISFLGIEDFYGEKGEWMGGVNGYGGTYYIYDGYQPNQVPTVPYRTVYCGFDSAKAGWITNLVWGEYADIIPTELAGSNSVHYCDYSNIAQSSWRVIYRSGNGGDAYSGVAMFNGFSTSSAVSKKTGSRLLYRGNIQVIDDPAEFIALPINM